MKSIAFFGFLLYLAIYLKKFDKLLRFVVIVLSTYFITFVGLSRIVLGEHWPTDVLWGYLFGLAYLGILILIDKYSMSKNKE